LSFGTHTAWLRRVLASPVQNLNRYLERAYKRSKEAADYYLSVQSSPIKRLELHLCYNVVMNLSKKEKEMNITQVPNDKRLLSSFNSGSMGPQPSGTL
jgi:hypothetical protein